MVVYRRRVMDTAKSTKTDSGEDAIDRNRIRNSFNRTVKLCKNVKKLYGPKERDADGPATYAVSLLGLLQGC